MKNLLQKMKQDGYSFRLENDEEAYFFSIISMKTYPRLWIDNMIEFEADIVCETLEHNITRKTQLVERDWIIRFSSETLEELEEQIQKYLSK